jgi:hypothetical protein
MSVRALGAFAVLIMGVGAAHAQEPIPLQEIAVAQAQSGAVPGGDLAVSGLSPQTQAVDPFSPSVWRSDDVNYAPAQGPQQHLRLSVGEAYTTPGGLPLTSADRAQMAGPQHVAVDYSLAAPGAIRFSTPEHDWSLTPHAGFGLGDRGSQANAGAVLSIRDRAVAALENLGVRDGSKLENRGRYYLFAAASGRAVGMNMLRDSDGALHKGGWTSDPASSLVGEAQVGVAWRKGEMQTSFGYVHRDYQATDNSLRGFEGRDDDRVAFSFTLSHR